MKDKTMKRVVCLLGFLTLLGGIQVSAQQADTIYHGGPIITVNDRRPTAQAVGIKDGRIIAVGKQADVFAHRGDETNLVDLAGRTMLPGFVDSHGHTYLIGLQATTANLLPPHDGTCLGAIHRVNLCRGQRSTWQLGRKSSCRA